MSSDVSFNISVKDWEAVKAEDQRLKTLVTAKNAEIENLKQENRRLRDMLQRANGVNKMVTAKLEQFGHNTSIQNPYML